MDPLVVYLLRFFLSQVGLPTFGLEEFLFKGIM